MSEDLTAIKKGTLVKVYNNNIASAMAQLKRKINTEGITKELRKRKHFEPNTLKRRRKLAEAQVRWKKKQDQINELDKPKKKLKKKPTVRTPNTNTTTLI